MANTSIYNAFERLWQHVVIKLGENKENTLESANENSANSNYSPVNNTDLATMEYIDNRIPEDDEVLEMLAEAGIVDPATNDGYILTDADGVIYSI